MRLVKKCLCMFLVLVMMGAVVPVAAQEAAAETDALSALRALAERFPLTSRDDAEPLPPEGLVLRRAWAGSPFMGIFHHALSFDTADAAIQRYLIYSLVAWCENHMFVRGDVPGFHAPVLMDWDVETRTVTFQMREGVRIFWSDNVELTLDDLKYAYEFISHPDYMGMRFGTENNTINVVGAREFRNGEADYISGLSLSEDKRTLTVSFVEGGFPPSALFLGILTVPLPRHHFEGIPVSEVFYHENARSNMLGFGPFILYEVVYEEFVLLRANPNYWQGRPLVDYILHEVIFGGHQAQSMREGLFDVSGFLVADFERYQHDTNTQFLGEISPSITYYYFTLGAMRRVPEPIYDYRGRPVFRRDARGRYLYVNPQNQQWNAAGTLSWVLCDDYFPIVIYRDAEGNTLPGPRGNVRAVTHVDTADIFFVPRTDNHPITDPRFRRAVGYAMDPDALNISLYNGLRIAAASVLHPFNAAAWIDPTSTGLSGFHPGRANALLDEIWYERGWPAWEPGNDDQPFRQVPHPTRRNAFVPFQLNFALRPVSGDLHETIFNHYQNNLREVGINLTLYAGDGVYGEFINHLNLVIRNITGQPTAFNLSPNDTMHMWPMSWNLAANPNPGTLWGDGEMFNLSRFSNETFTNILNDISSDAAWEPDFLAETYRRWAAAFETYVPAIYENWQIVLTKLNNRVVGWTLCRSHLHEDSFSWHRVGLTATQPYRHNPR